MLPALLALRRTHAAIRETQAFLASPETSTDKARRRLESEQANLKDQRALQSALKNRLHTLRLGLETKEGQSPDQLVEARMGQLRQQKRDYDRDTSALLKSLNQFIAKYLGSMLAAEELGGPVVGDMMEIDPDGLEAGFNAQGKPKRAKVSDADSNTRQRRLDQIWGTEGGDQTRPGSKKRDRDESVAAGAEMRNLVEDLLNSLVQSGGDTSAAYVKISRESAAVRFLVRSKVAQFHPKDATRLRLIDFGRELDD